MVNALNLYNEYKKMGIDPFQKFLGKKYEILIPLNDLDRFSYAPAYGKEYKELGIYDMAGNVCEWCQYYYGSYVSSSQTNPTGAVSGSYRVYRGGSWFNGARGYRSSCRGINTPDYRIYGLGLRLVLSE